MRVLEPLGKLVNHACLRRPNTGEWKELGRKLEEDRKRQDFLARERAKMMEMGQRGEMSIEDEKELKRSVVKGHWSLAKDKASIHAGMEKVQSYEEAFTKIQAATV